MGAAWSVTTVEEGGHARLLRLMDVTICTACLLYVTLTPGGATVAIGKRKVDSPEKGEVRQGLF